MVQYRDRHVVLFILLSRSAGIVQERVRSKEILGSVLKMFVCMVRSKETLGSVLKMVLCMVRSKGDLGSAIEDVIAHDSLLYLPSACLVFSARGQDALLCSGWCDAGGGPRERGPLKGGILRVIEDFSMCDFHDFSLL